ncbi:MAG: PH domain-containing protein [Bacteroidota bacterium]
MNKVYKSEKDLKHGLLIWSPTVLMLIISVIRISNIIEALNIIPTHLLLFGSLLFLNFSAFVWFMTEYRIKGGNLIIRFGLFRTFFMKIDNIIEITEVKASKRAPALSNNQILLKSKTGFEIAISPKDRELFLKDLDKEISKDIA